MKKNILLVLFAMFSFAFATNAQTKSCCSKAKDKASCSKDAKAQTSTQDEAQAVLVANTSEVETQKKQFKVYGNCGMCKRKIEGAVKDEKGVNSAKWDMKTGQMTVEFDPAQITFDNIKQKIADVGYDSETHRAKDEVYNNLHGCCQYERPSKG